MEEKDIEVLTPVMKAAFDTDTRMHTELAEDGPAGYDTGELLRRLLKLENAVSKVICADGRMIGEYTVRQSAETCTLEMFFIDPLYASRGIGTRVWMDMEREHGDGKTWLLETPDYSLRNHHFYEKCGFEKIGENIFPGGARSFLFRKKGIS